MILIPARNEAPRIGWIIDRCRSAVPDMPIVVVVNGCTDDTGAVAHEHGADIIESRPGYGEALLSGYRHALALGVDSLVQLDADGQHPPEAIPGLLATLGELDLAIGSRLVDGGSAPGWPRHRRWINHALGWWVTALTGHRLKDVMSGFQAMRRPVIEALGSDFPVNLTDANVLVRLHRQGFSIGEVGVQMPPRAGGISMHGGWTSALYVGRTAIAAAREASR